MMFPAASEHAVALIQSAEGFRARAYWDAAGKVWTIGFGETRGITPGMTWTRAQAELALRADLAELRSELGALVRVDVTQGAADALYSWAYNFGAPRLASSTLLKRLNAGDTIGAAAEFQHWCYAAGKVEPGLVARRAAETKLFLSDHPQCLESSSLPQAS